MSRRYLNLVLHDFESRMYSLYRINLCKHLFYRNSEIARVAGENKTKQGVMDGWKKLPAPAINFQPMPSWRNSRMAYLFSLLGGENDILYSDSRCQTTLYNVDMKFVQGIAPPNSSKTANVISLPISQADPVDPMNKRQSLYILDLSPISKIDRCFEVLSYHEKWRWDLLPPPPFFRDPETAPDLYSYAVVDRSTICISSLQDQGIGTYTFDTVSRKWRQVANWILPFFGKAEYVPELNLWLGLSARSPFSSLCALDLSAMDSAHPPIPQHTLQYLDLPEDEVWSPTQLHLLNLGSGKFCVATFFGTPLRTCPYSSDKYSSYKYPSDEYSSDEYSSDEDTDGKEYAIFTGLEVKPSNEGGGSIQLIKHMSKRFTVGRRNIECVL